MQRGGNKKERNANHVSLRYLAHEALEGELADEELGRLLVAADFTERDRAGAVSMGPLRHVGIHVLSTYHLRSCLRGQLKGNPRLFASGIWRVGRSRCYHLVR